MKKILFPMVLSLALTTYAQQKEGRVIYTRTLQMQVNINDNDQMTQMLPKSMVDKFELTFGKIIKYHIILSGRYQS